MFIRSSMYERGFKMIEKLEAIQVGHNPIIWVAHSKGGLFVKQMLVHGQFSIFTLRLFHNSN